MSDPERRALEDRCLAIASTHELDQLQERILEEFCGLTRAQSGALWVAGERGPLRLRAFRGLVDRRQLPETVDPSLVQLIPWRSGPSLLVPVVQGTQVVGLAQLADALAPFDEALFKPAHAMAQFAAAALKGALKVATLQRQGLRDRDTGAYTLSYFADYATKEIYKAKRYGRAFSLLTVALDNLTQVRVRQGVEAARTAQRATLRVLSRMARDADVVARASEQEFHVLLPETDSFGGLMFLRRALAALREDPESKDLEAKLPLGVSAGVATFPHDGEDFDELLERCHRRMDERRRSLHRALRLDGLPFWDEVELLLGNSKSPKLPETEGEPSRRGRVAEVLFDELQTELARELARAPSTRGLLYLGVPEVRSDLPLVHGLAGASAELKANIFVIGRRGDLGSHPVVTPVFLEGDDRLGRHEFLLWVGEGSSYVLLQRRGRGVTWGFHSSDPTLVEGMVSQLQQQYDLQPW
ncbi:MAG: diguanylate cyclase [Myxococcaceae bacterium]|nr:diguanylate cyclase [Myxococcaceae bacterium]